MRNARIVNARGNATGTHMSFCIFTRMVTNQTAHDEAKGPIGRPKWELQALAKNTRNGIANLGLFYCGAVVL